jgi:hypothetical protein
MMLKREAALLLQENRRGEEERKTRKDSYAMQFGIRSSLTPEPSAFIERKGK